MKISKLYIVLCVFCFTSCFDLNIKRIEITTEYIINENWDEYAARSFMVGKMKVKKDSTINPFSDLNEGEILSKLENDSTFRWFVNVDWTKKSNKDKKIYFTKDNGFIWQDDVTGRETNIFGSLEINTWYRFSGLLSYRYEVFIYVDSANQVHRFDGVIASW